MKEIDHRSKSTCNDIMDRIVLSSTSYEHEAIKIPILPNTRINLEKTTETTSRSQPHIEP